MVGFSFDPCPCRPPFETFYFHFQYALPRLQRKAGSVNRCHSCRISAAACLLQARNGSPSTQGAKKVISVCEGGIHGLLATRRPLLSHEQAAFSLEPIEPDAAPSPSLLMRL